MDTTILEEIGLTKGEIKVYLALLELGASTAGSILEKAKVHNSALHFSLNNLISKALVTYVKKGKVRIYQAVSPKSLVDYIDEKKKELEKVLPELAARQSMAREKEMAEIFEGTKGINAMLSIMIENARKGDEFLFFSISEGDVTSEIHDFYMRWYIKRTERGIIEKGIAPLEIKDSFKRRPKSKMKFVNFKIPQNMGIFKNMTCIVIWGENPRGILIKSKAVAEKNKKFFDELWNSA
jgi:sugar-specific transcriptional regulator TrmB